MNSRIRTAILATALSTIALAAAATAHEPKQPATPEQITEYYEGGHFNEDLTAKTKRATTVLKSQLKRKPRRPAIVFDIDDTLESTYTCAKRANFERDAITTCIATFDQTPIKPVWRLLRYAQKRKVAIFIVTGRPDGLRDGTIKQLREDGLRGRYTLVTRPNDEFGQPAAGYKTGVREDIEADGYTTLVNIGDQQSDLSGGFSKKRFKVPNPMYFTP
jgi:predicted secreted acid phosphatase